MLTITASMPIHIMQMMPTFDVVLVCRKTDAYRKRALFRNDQSTGVENLKLEIYFFVESLLAEDVRSVLQRNLDPEQHCR